MSKISRNDLCPCGSGQKYKKCCLARDEEFDARRREEEKAVQIAITWLTSTYPEETAQAVFEGFFGEITEEDEEYLNELPGTLQQMVRINSIEWMLADGELNIDGEMKRAVDLVLGKGGPLMPARGQEWLKALGQFPMSLYEVQESQSGKGLLVVDLLYSAAEPVWVQERSASRSLVRWDIFGARLAKQGTTWVFSGALYPFNREEGLYCRNELLDVIEAEEPCEADRRILVGTTIIDTWLIGLIDDELLPEVVDASTGDTILLTTDHYRVADWPEFERILAEQDDVDGDRENGWDRCEELEDGRYRSLAALQATGSDSLEVFCRTTQRADEIRQWLEGLAEGVITYKIREVVDPRSENAQQAITEEPEDEIPQELKRQIIHQYLAKHYESWLEMPLPALEGKCPFEAVNDAQLRLTVMELLKSIDQLEARRIDQTGGEPFDVTFLWDRLGMTR